MTQRHEASIKDKTIIEGTGAKPAIEERVKQIRAQIENTTSDCGREKLRAAGEADGDTDRSKSVLRPSPR